LPVLPSPVVLFGFMSTWFNASFEFIGEPSLNMIIAPEQKIRVSTIIWMVQYRGIEDLLFDITLWYRFFSSEHQFGDFAGLGLGLMNNDVMFFLGEKDKSSYEVNKYSAYVTIDLSFLRITGGYIFNGKEIFDNSIKNDIDKGFYISTQLAWRF